MRRILLACITSLVVYIAAFAWLLDRPLTLGALRTRVETTVALGRTIHQPVLERAGDLPERPGELGRRAPACR